MSQLDIRQIPLLSDNYSYLMLEPVSGNVAVVDPAEADPVRQALDRLCEEAKVALASAALPGSPTAHALAGRFQEICDRHHFGDPVKVGRFQAAFGRIKRGNRWVMNDARTTAAWEYLALAARSWSMRDA